VAFGDVRRQPPYGASTSLISWLAGERWIEASGEYAFYNAGAWLGDMPTERLVEVAYYLIKRDTLSGIAEKEIVTARERAMSNIDNTLSTAGDDDETGLPSWVMSSGIGPADGSDWGSPFG
jgi:hypothetical protein